MTDNFFGKTLAARKVDEIPGMLEFDIPVHGDNPSHVKMFSVASTQNLGISTSL